jgi:hypothetical protein
MPIFRMATVERGGVLEPKYKVDSRRILYSADKAECLLDTDRPTETIPADVTQLTPAQIAAWLAANGYQTTNPDQPGFVPATVDVPDDLERLRYELRRLRRDVDKIKFQLGIA